MEVQRALEILQSPQQYDVLYEGDSAWIDGTPSIQTTKPPLSTLCAQEMCCAWKSGGSMNHRGINTRPEPPRMEVVSLCVRPAWALSIR